MDMTTFTEKAILDSRQSYYMITSEVGIGWRRRRCMNRMTFPVKAIMDSWLVITGKWWDGEDVEMLFIADYIFSSLLSCSPAMRRY